MGSVDLARNGRRRWRREPRGGSSRSVHWPRSHGGDAAAHKMSDKRYGLGISDWNMEPMTGYDLLKEIRGDPHLAGTPFIMVTAESKTGHVIAAKKAGVDNYIVKPFNAQTLKSKIETVFAG